MKVAMVGASILIAIGAVGSMWFLRRSARVAMWCAVMESVGALIMVALVAWDVYDGSLWWPLPVWVVALAGAVGNWWICRRIDRVRALAKIDVLDELAKIKREIEDGPTDGRQS